MCVCQSKTRAVPVCSGTSGVSSLDTHDMSFVLGVPFTPYSNALTSSPSPPPPHPPLHLHLLTLPSTSSPFPPPPHPPLHLHLLTLPSTSSPSPPPPPPHPSLHLLTLPSTSSPSPPPPHYPPLTFPSISPFPPHLTLPSPLHYSPTSPFSVFLTCCVFINSPLDMPGKCPHWCACIRNTPDCRCTDYGDPDKEPDFQWLRR